MASIEEIDWEGKVVRIRDEKDLKTEMFPHKVVLVIPRSSENTYIFSKRSKDKHPYPDTYVCGIGGKVRENETLEQAAIRESQEEVGLTFKLKKVAQFKYNTTEYTAIFTIFTSLDQIDIRDLKPNPEEIQYFKALTLDEVKEAMSQNESNYAPTFVEAFNHFVRNM